MGKPKKELFEFDKQTNELLFDHCSYYENSVVFRFLNIKFNQNEPDRKKIELLKNIFNHDEMLSSDTLLKASHFYLLEDYNNNLNQQIIYFNFLQEELRRLFVRITEFKPDKKSFIPEGRFQSLEKDMEGLGTLKYELVFGKLFLRWDDKIKSFRQVILRSLITFFNGDKAVLKHLCICQSTKCGKIYFNKKGNFEFCAPSCGKKHHDVIRNNKLRYDREIANPNSARSKAIDKAARKRAYNKSTLFRKKSNKLI